jgi:hypothetical protein
MEYPDIEYDTKPQKTENRYFVKCWNTTYEDDLLFQTPVVILDKEVKPDDDDVSIIGEPIETFFDMLKEDHLQKAIDFRDTWFKGKNISEEVLPDLWKDNLRKGRVTFKKGDDPDEPFTIYRQDGEKSTETALSSGTSVILLLRLEGLWISRSKIGSTYTVVQVMDMTPEERKPISKISKCTIQR